MKFLVGRFVVHAEGFNRREGIAQAYEVIRNQIVLLVYCQISLKVE